MTGFRNTTARIISTLLVCATVAHRPAGIRGSTASRRDSQTRMVTVSITRRPANRFIPSRALGAAIDAHEKGELEQLLSPSTVQVMLSAGFKPLTYRLKTELAGDAWHWNPQGTWSDPQSKQGYWTSDATTGRTISVSYGYRLPRRGNTGDQAANVGYSRVDDGDGETFWKSNPYLDRHFTGEDNVRHPQWVVIDLGSETRVNSIRLLWGAPFATSYEIQYANFDDLSDISLNPPAMWRTFPKGKVNNGKGGDVFLKLVRAPVRTRYVRTLLTAASGTGPSASTDIRDTLGYALREVYVGLLDRKGQFHDAVRHTVNHSDQTAIYVSSTDPWHREKDLDQSVEQPGFDRIFQSGLTNGLPMLTPVSLLYDTPENAAAEISYLKSRGYPVERLELGEEPDGQYATPEDYAALYIQWVSAVHKVAPELKLGGPSLQEIQPDTEERRVKLGNSVWLKRFLNYLNTHGHLGDFSFFSFEWYPFDDVCDPVPPQMARATDMLTNALRELQQRGLSRQIPWIISEYGYSAYASRAEIDIEGALLNADIVGRFLTLGGDQAYLFGYTPGQVVQQGNCTAGNIMLLGMNSDGKIVHRYATYFGAKLLTQEWVNPSGGWHLVYPASTNVPHRPGESLVTAYAVYRPDGLWALMLINKHPRRAWTVGVRFHKGKTGLLSLLQGPVDVYQFSAKQYVLSEDEKHPYPIKSEPPEHTVLEGGKKMSFELPAYSLTVIRGAGPTPEQYRSN